MKTKRRIEITILRRRETVAGGATDPTLANGGPSGLEGVPEASLLNRLAELRICDGQLVLPESLPQLEHPVASSEAADKSEALAPRRTPFSLRIWRRHPPDGK
jgi:hypothetical protein